MNANAVDLELLQIVEALLTASPEPLTQDRLNQALDQPAPKLSAIIAELSARFQAQARPVEIVAVAGGYQLVTRPEYRHYLQRMFRKTGRLVLSRAALETIAIVAYRQPLTKADLDQIRGVNSDSVLKSLLEKRLITIKGRDETVGRPLLYGTTPAFLEAFGLAGLGDLPKLREIAEIMGDGQGPTQLAHAT